MSTFTIGRIGVDTASGGDGTTLQHPYEWSQQGRMVTLAGIHQAATDAAAVWLQRQIIGLDPANNPDEEWVPVTSSTASDLNGYFRVTGAQAVIPQGSLGTGTRLVQWQVQMERAPAWRSPLVEMSLVYATLTNSSSITNVCGLNAVPNGGVVDWSPSFGTYGTRAGENGTAEVNYVPVAAALSAGTGVTKIQLAPASHYTASAYIESATLGKVVGRGDAAPGDGWRIGNGLIRAGSFTNNTFSFQWWNGSSWATGSTIKFEPQYANTATRTWRSVSVLRNSPDECALRLVLAGNITATSITAVFTFDIALRRGERFLRCYAAGAANTSHKVGFSTTVGSTSTTWGIRSTATINSQYVVFTSDNGTTKDTTNGTLAAASVASGRSFFSVGVSGDGTTNGGLDGSDAVQKQAFVVYGSSQRVVF